jgi:N-acetyl-1-D-myo-inositol-2-amino-2-deoxy-alpha-D-glucopyranoside deacetylase
VLITYDEQGGYGHPDHIQAHRVAMRALDLAADPAHGAGEMWTVAKVYWNAMPESRMREGIRRLREAGDTTSFENQDPDGEMPPHVVPDEQVTTRIDGMEFVEAKLAAMRAHFTQIAVDGPFFALSNNLGNEVWGEEYYRLVRGEPGERDGAGGRETDVFSGLEPT